VPRLLTDAAYADRVTGELEAVVRNLSEVSEKLNRGEGTVPRLINEPDVHDAVQDILIGVNESRLLRWLIRNRQRAGIETRYREAVRAQQEADEEPAASTPTTGEADDDITPGAGREPESEPSPPPVPDDGDLGDDVTRGYSQAPPPGLGEATRPAGEEEP
jgi:hypothetical protein